MASMTIREIDPERDARADRRRCSCATTRRSCINAAEWLHRTANAFPSARSARIAASPRSTGGSSASARRCLDFFGGGGRATASSSSDVRARSSRRQGVGTRALRARDAHARARARRRRVAHHASTRTTTGVAFARTRGCARGARRDAVDARSAHRRRAHRRRTSTSGRVAELDPRELHRIDEEATRDMPSTRADRRASRTTSGSSSCWDNPLFTRDGSFGAVVDGSRRRRLVAAREPRARARAQHVHRRPAASYRGRGLALAVKLASIALGAPSTASRRS